MVPITLYSLLMRTSTIVSAGSNHPSFSIAYLAERVTNHMMIITLVGPEVWHHHICPINCKEVY